MTTHDLVRELAEKAGHATTVTVGAIGSIYSLFLNNPIGFICALVAIASFVVNWYYSYQRHKMAREQQGQRNASKG
ncbi:holin [Microbulbifer sp. 2205BS26-8]|uniref:holin n=1 Tax=Microbulbifer sp. 2205BS26-8 TaxID=3064386 RepID=UPI00273D8A29|nr:holin [Microbulbifer sp. 2205BS26-8]MDP5210986.1 holin [Microbulbifer sp. 2205BS26-8]